MKKIVIAKDLQPLFLSAIQFLNRSDIEIHAAATADDVLTMHFEHRAVLIVTRLDLPGMHCETMINIIRRNDALKSVSILVLSKNDESHGDHHTLSGVNAVLPMPADPALLAPTVSKLLNVEPRRDYRVVLNMSVDGVHDNKPFLCYSENISSRGILIRTTEALSPGCRITCSFWLPDGTRVGADGDVARVLKQPSGVAINQYGVRFLSMPPKAEESIASFVSKGKQMKEAA